MNEWYKIYNFIFKNFIACSLIEFNGNPKYITDIQSEPFIFQENFFPNSNGANFNTIPVVIVVTFTPEQERQFLEFEFVDKISNIKEYLLKIYDNSNNIIAKINGSNSIILSKINITVDKFISKIEIIIISTTDNKPTNHVRISIKGLPSGCISTTKHTTNYVTKTSIINSSSRSGKTESESQPTQSQSPFTTPLTIASSHAPSTQSGTIAPFESSFFSSSVRSSRTMFYWIWIT